MRTSKQNYMRSFDMIIKILKTFASTLKKTNYVFPSRDCLKTQLYNNHQSAAWSIKKKKKHCPFWFSRKSTIVYVKRTRACKSSPTAGSLVKCARERRANHSNRPRCTRRTTVRELLLPSDGSYSRDL